MPHTFLSDEWIEAVVGLQTEYLGRIAAPEQSIVMNQVINDVPFGTGTLYLHVDTRSGVAEVDHGHTDEADVTITTDYDTAKTLFMTSNPQEIMMAFMSGRVLIEGDMAKLLVVQGDTVEPDDAQREVAEKLRSLTAD
ncbi:MAG: SCP2 sterol-binding domain-containing protein [Actinomycetia bacterium]|nr:SCP2 sterol-binding domain-containing protein [Actinomycetes bacterium]MCP4959433.1 SCP2 sterol-binding domain-containing protein [Actinomycetes bacterium]